jgi:hypothetical protein
MVTFFCRLIPPRTTFAKDLSPDEAQLMQEHAGYWHGLMKHGKVVAFGLVGDPAGAYGIGILEVADEAEVRKLTADDPTRLSGRGFRYEVHPMPRGAVHLPTIAA